MKITRQVLITAFVLSITFWSLLWVVWPNPGNAYTRPIPQSSIREFSGRYSRPQAISTEALQDTIRKREEEILRRIHEIMASASLCRQQNY